ncbi:MAG: hypothetical protein WBF67_06400, partial [Olleya sp.]
NHVKRTFHKYVKKGIVPSANTVRDVVIEDKIISKWPENKQATVKIKGCLQNFRNKFLKNR